MSGTPYYAASSPYYNAGAQTAAAAGSVLGTVAAPVVGFTSGVLQGRAGLYIGLIILGAVLLNAREKR